MASGDRDYMRDEGPRSPLAWFRSLSLTTRLIGLNVAVFLAWLVPGAVPFLQSHFTVSGVGLLEELRVWTVFTSAFSHQANAPGGLLHISFNMVVLYVFCPEVEALYGRRNTFALYLLGAFGCALGHVGLNMVWGNPYQPMLGASGAVLALVIVLTLATPRRRMHLFGVIPCPLWGLAGLILLVDLAGAAAATQGLEDGISHAGHLGGVLAGLAFKLLDLRPVRSEGAEAAAQGLGAWLSRPRPPKLRVLPPLEAEEHPLAEREREQERIDADTAGRVDELLRKINREGMDALTPEEKRFLEEASLRYRR